MLINNSIKLFDTGLSITAFKDNDLVKIRGKDLILNNGRLFSNSCINVNKDYIFQKSIECGYNYSSLLCGFIENTLHYAEQDRNNILNFSDYPELCTNINGRPAIVVARSTESEKALLSLKSYIEINKPILIGVDGGADTIISSGFSPDLLIGDMDSVSDVGLFRSKEIILHAYMDGRCPCLDRITQLNLKYKLIAIPGTSEDAALLLAYDKGASRIILIGGHNYMTDFLEKGRKGMGSTLVTRLKIEDRLIDYRHIMKLQDLTESYKSLHYSNDDGDLLWMQM